MLTKVDQQDISVDSDIDYLARVEQISDADFIKKVYKDFLWREPDAGGFQDWQERLITGDITRHAILDNVRNSNEFRIKFDTQIRHVFIEITNICNFHCSFCPSDLQTRDHGHISLDLFRKIVDEIVEKKLVKYVALHVMGEPTLHPQLLDILQILNENDITVSFNTNCGTLEDEDYIHQLMDNLYGTICLSLQTPTEQSYKLRGAGRMTWSTYEEKVKTLVRHFMLVQKKRRASGMGRMSQTFISILNSSDAQVRAGGMETLEDVQHAVEKWAVFMESLEIEYDLPTYPRPPLPDYFEDNDLNQHVFIYPLQEDLYIRSAPAHTFANTRYDKRKYKIPELNDSPQCMNPFKQMAIYWNGDASLCCLDSDRELQIGNVVNNSLTDVWFDQAATDVRQSMHGLKPVPKLCGECTACLVEK
jgi:MoaA/NifB/PqqE/SkfB family radical SAM enzyme